jgi:RNA polymerase sigma factor (sigma-70 family)
MKTIKTDPCANLSAAKGRNVRQEELEAIEPEMSLYRERTTAMLRRYLQLSVELGRVPSLLGREFFRSRVTSYRMHNFEDVVIFVHDVEQCLEKMDPVSQQFIVRVALQEYTYQETANLLGCTRRTVERRYPESLDRLTRLLLDHELLQEMSGERSRERRRPEAAYPPKKPVARVQACQEEKISRPAINR